MKTAKRRYDANVIATEVGTMLGGVGFLFVGLLGGVVYGGSLGLIVAGMLFGTPVPPTIWARGLTFLGIILGVVTSAVVFVGAGFALGKGVGYLLSLVLSPAPAPKAAPRREIRLPALNEENTYAQRGRMVGAWVGGALFLSVGLWIGLVYGGEGGLLLAAIFFGAPVPHIFLARAMVIIGMLFGVLSAATVCLVVGSVIGTLVGYMVSLFSAVLWASVMGHRDRRAES